MTFSPPTFGLTFLGTSHGFDPNGHTTGFIVWINGQGILVDPPSHTSKYLRANGIRPSWVNRVILTHCHSDHDAGTLHMISSGEKIELFTTKTINSSYLRKLKAITGMDMSGYYTFVPVPIGTPFDILGGTFEFDYSFHTIPTVRFKVRYADKSISYSADTFYGPEVIFFFNNLFIFS